MDRSMLLHHLDLAKRHVAIGEKNVARQRAVVAELERDGHDASEARRLLAEFEQLQSMHIQDRDRLLKELDGNR